MTKKETLLLTLIFLFIIISHLLLIQFNVLKGEFTTALIIDGVLTLFPLLSILLLSKSDKNKDTFAQRYLILTTLQFIGFLSGILVMVYGRISDVKYWSFSALIIFLLFLTTQTVLLLRALASNSSEQSNKESNYC